MFIMENGMSSSSRGPELVEGTPGSSSIKISAVVPNYNSIAFLPRCIKSLLAQTEAFDEIIIVDDGSTDNSVEVIESWVKTYPHIRLIRHEKNLGVNPASNTGIKNTDADFILMAAADDWFAPNVVAKAKQIANEFPQVGVICGDALVYRYDLKQPFYRALPFPPNQLITPTEFRAITKKTYAGFNGGGMFMNRHAVVEGGMLYSDTLWHADWILYFSLALRHGIYYFNDLFINIEMRKLSYSEGKRNQNLQNRVMLETIKVIHQSYPDLWNDFRQAALVPHHHFSYIPLFLSDSIAKKYITPRFIWKMLINNPVIVYLGRCFPYSLTLKVRKLLKA